MLKKYEVIVIFDPDLDDEGVRSQIEKIASIVQAHGGSVEQEDLWGRRPLGYPIKKKQHGTMVLLIVSGDNTFVADLRRQLRINDQVLRVSVVNKDKFAPDLHGSAREDVVEGAPPVSGKVAKAEVPSAEPAKTEAVEEAGA